LSRIYVRGQYFGLLGGVGDLEGGVDHQLVVADVGLNALLHDRSPREEGGKAELVHLVAALQLPIVHLQYRNR